MVNFVNGETPLNDTNLNKLQTDLQNDINTKYNNLIGTVIFEYQDTTEARQDSITFTESLNTGDSIEIFYGRIRANDTIVLRSTGKIKYVSGMIISLDMIYNTVSGAENDAKRVIINSNGLTTDDKINNNIGITKIIKYTN